jgi:hypothetical protein
MENEEKDDSGEQERVGKKETNEKNKQQKG